LTLGLWSAYLPFGVCVGLALSPIAIAAVGWSGWWVLLTGATLACMAALAAFRRHYTGVRRAQPRTAADLRRALGQPAPWLYGTAFAAYTVSFHGVVVWVPTYVQQTQNAGLAQGSLLAAAMMLANVGGNLYGARLAQRGVPRGRIMTAAFLLGGLIAVGIYAPGVAPAARYACALLFNLVVGVIPAAVMSGVPRYAGSAAEVATLQGVVVQLSNVGIFGGPPLVAVAVTWGGGWEATIVVLLAAAAAGAALSVWLARFERRVLPAAV
ncbi:MAG TPA: MFS transporter, partial [Burkholderiales bacterium]